MENNMNIYKIISILETINNKDVMMVIYIIKNTDTTTHMFERTYRRMSEDLNITLATIVRFFKKLKQLGLIELIDGGKYKVNIFNTTIVSQEPNEFELGF